MLEKYLNVQTAIVPRLSPDGTKLAFIGSMSGTPQIWITAANKFSEPQQLTFSESVMILDWSPNGEWIAYSADNEGDERQGYFLVSSDGQRREILLAPNNTYRVWGGFSPDGKRVAFAANEAGTYDFNIYAHELKSNETKVVYQGEGGLYPVSWQPNGKGLLLLRVVAADANEVLYLDLITGKTQVLLAPEESSYHNFFSWKPDSRGFFLATNQNREFGGLAFYDLTQNEFSWLETPECDVESVALSTNGKYLAWFENNGGFSRLYIFNQKTGEIKSLENLPRGVIYEIRWAIKAEKLAIELSGPNVAGDIWIYTPDSDELFRGTVSDSAGLNPAGFTAPEIISFTAHDGENIHGLLYLPCFSETKLPVVIHLHGGPTMQSRPRFDAFHQYLIAQGCAVFDLNYRGSIGYGKRFMRLDNRLLRKDAIVDIASAAKYLKKNKKLNGEKIALMGESYGGFMVLAGLVNFPEMFCCGIDIVGISDWLTALENTLPQLMASDEAEYGDIKNAEIRNFLFDLSPVNHIEKIQSPLLVIHGENDPRVPVSQAHQIVERLKKQGKDVEILIFEDEGHGIRKLSNRLSVYQKTGDFLKANL